MKNYLFYAECDHDTKDLPQIFKHHDIHGILTQKNRLLATNPPLVVPGWEVQFKTDAPMDKIKAALEEVPDGHMMVETLMEWPSNT